MATRGRGLPLRKKKRDQIKGQRRSTSIPLRSGARREDVQMQVEGSEGGMTVHSAKRRITHGVCEAARGSGRPNCAASDCEKEIRGMTLEGCTSRGSVGW